MLQTSKQIHRVIKHVQPFHCNASASHWHSATQAALCLNQGACRRAYIKKVSKQVHAMRLAL